MRCALASTLLVLLAACSLPKEEEVRPSFALPSVSGDTVTLASFKGRVVYVDFWATWCGECVKAIPELNGLQERLQKEGFSVLGISVDDLPIGEVAKFAGEKKIAYPVLVSTLDLIDDFGPTPGLPTGYLVDKTGRVRRKFVGALPLEVVEKAARELLSEPAGG